MKLNSKQYLLAILSLALVYYFFGQLGLLIQKYPGITPMWPPSGIAIAAAILFGKRIWPGITLGVLILAYSARIPFTSTVTVTLGNTVEPILAVYLLEKTVNLDTLFEQVKNIFTYLGFAVFVAPIISATVGAFGFCAGGAQPWSEFNSMWLTWWLGNATGNLVLAPFILVWKKRPEIQISRLEIIETVALFTLLIVVGWSIFEIHYFSASVTLPLTYLPMPIVLWIAIRRSLHGATAANVIIAVIAILGGLHSSLIAAGQITKTLLLEVTFIGVTASTSLMVAAAFHERRLSEEILRNIVEATASFTGADFFRSLVKHLALTLEVKDAFVCEIVDSSKTQSQTLAFWAHDHFLENFRYALKDTPCKKVVEGSIQYYPAHLQQLFTNFDSGQKLNANSYLGIPLQTASNNVLGHLAIMDEDEFKKENRLKTLVKIFAARAAAELQREQTERAFRENVTRTKAIVNTAAEGILTTDQHGMIETFNPAAEFIFGFTSYEIIGQHFSTLFTDSSNQFQKDLQNMSIDDRNVIESGYELTGKRKNGSVFPLHLSTSRMELNDKTHYTYIVQDITERKHAQKVLFDRMRISEFGEKIGQVLMQVQKLGDALQGCCNEMITHFDAALARIWIYDETKNTLTLQASAGLYTEINGKHSQIPLGKYKIGIIAQQQKQHLTNKLTDDPLIHDQAWVKQHQLQGFIGYPLLVEEHLLGVIALFSKHPFEHPVIEALSSAASSIAQMVSRKNAQKALKQSETRYRLLVENAPVGILTCDTKGNILDINQEILNLVGSPSKETTQKYNLLTFPRLVEAGISEDIKKCLRGQNIVSERPYVSLSGKNAFLRLNLVPTRDSRKRITGVQAIVENILDKKLAEDKIIANEMHFRTLIEKMYEGIAILKSDGTIVYESPSVERILGYKPEFLIGKNIFQFMHPQDHEQIKQRLSEIEKFKDGEHTTSTFRIKHKNGTYRLLEATSTVQRGDSSIYGIVTNYRDITEKAATEQQIINSLKEKDVLLREVHHRVKNNLQVISSLLKLQTNSIQNKPALRILNESRNRVKAMALIHENLYKSQDLAKISCSQYFNDLTRQVLRSYLSVNQKIALNITIDDIFLDIDLAVPCGLIVTELVSNSLLHAFHKQNAGQIDVSFHKKGRKKYMLTVADNGLGLPDTFNIRKTDSLGLQLVQELTQQIDGNLNINQKDGTEFLITF